DVLQQLLSHAADLRLIQWPRGSDRHHHGALAAQLEDAIDIRAEDLVRYFDAAVARRDGDCRSRPGAPGMVAGERQACREQLRQSLLQETVERLAVPR